MKTNPKPAILGLLRRAAFGLLGLGLASCTTTKSHRDAPVTTKVVDLGRYAGRWFEIARLPLYFQKANESAIAEYGSNPDGTVSVHNVAVRPDGTQHDIRGYAKVLNPPSMVAVSSFSRRWISISCTWMRFIRKPWSARRTASISGCSRAPPPFPMSAIRRCSPKLNNSVLTYRASLRILSLQPVTPRKHDHENQFACRWLNQAAPRTPCPGLPPSGNPS
ncbi:MAG: lipocalin family protein [Verrucomicrobia bacterium]|nr:lipocalin family protein [Verrucomicrobiota bacterium]